MASGSPVLWWEGVTGLPSVWRRPGGWFGLLPCLASLLEDVALVGNQTHEAKNEEEHPHQTCLPPQSPLAPWAVSYAGVPQPRRSAGA